MPKKFKKNKVLWPIKASQNPVKPKHVIRCADCLLSRGTDGFSANQIKKGSSARCHLCVQKQKQKNAFVAAAKKKQKVNELLTTVTDNQPIKGRKIRDSETQQTHKYCSGCLKNKIKREFSNIESEKKSSARCIPCNKRFSENKGERVFK